MLRSERRRTRYGEIVGDDRIVADEHHSAIISQRAVADGTVVDQHEAAAGVRCAAGVGVRIAQGQQRGAAHRQRAGAAEVVAENHR